MIYLKRLRKKIEKIGSQRDVAERLDVSHQYLSDVLAGKRALSIPFAYKVDTILGINMFPMLRDQLAKEWANYLKEMI